MNPRALVLLTAFLFLSPFALALAPRDVGTPDVSIAPGDYFVGFFKDPFLKPGQTYMGEEIKVVDHDLLFIIVHTNNYPAFHARASLDQNVRYVEFDDPHYAHLDLVPNDPQYSAAGHWGSKKINAEQAWDVTTGSTAVKVAMIDSGIFRTHEDVAGPRLLQGWNFIANTNSPDDESGCSYHGSHTTGTAGATINNGKGIAGMSQHTILPVKGLGYVSGVGCTASDSQLVNSLKYAGDQGAQISSNSWGGGGVSTTINDAILYSYNKGVIFVGAAGNSGPCTNCVGEPWKSNPSISIIVASTTETDTQSSFSSEGPEVDVSAPGSNILSLGGGVSTYQTLSGTSMATPHVAGTAALIKAVNPAWTFTQVQSQLQNTALDLGTSGYDQKFGYGRIRADLAVGAGSCTGTIPAAPTGLGATAGSGQVALSWTDGSNGGCAISGHKIYRSTTSGGETLLTTTGTATTYTDTAVTGGTTYYYKVTSTNVKGESAQSNEASATPTAPACPGPANNCFASAITVAAAGATVTGSNVGATTETGEPAPCGGMAATDWWTWTPTTSGSATIDTTGSNYDTVAAVYTGSSVGALTNVGCNDDIASGNTASKVTWTATAGTTYRIQIGGYNGATGSITLKVTAPASCVSGGPTNDCFSAAQAFSAKPQTWTQSTTGATKETGEPAPCGGIAATVWYTFSQATTGTVTFVTAGSNYDTVLAAYTGSSVGGLTNVACNDDISGGTTSSISFTATAGVTYRIQVGGYNGATGSLSLNVS